MQPSKRKVSRPASAVLGVVGFLATAVWQATPLAAGPPELEYAYPDISVWTTKRDAQGKLQNPLVKLAGPLFEKAGKPFRRRVIFG